MNNGCDGGMKENENILCSQCARVGATHYQEWIIRYQQYLVINALPSKLYTHDAPPTLLFPIPKQTDVSS